jgi:hypothetical protein
MLDVTDPDNPVNAAPADLHATLSPNGASQSFSFKSRFGNIGQHVSGVDQPLLSVGTLTDGDVDSGASIDFSGCAGHHHADREHPPGHLRLASTRSAATV